MHKISCNSAQICFRDYSTSLHTMEIMISYLCQVLQVTCSGILYRLFHGCRSLCISLSPSISSFSRCSFKVWRSRETETWAQRSSEVVLWQYCDIPYCRTFWCICLQPKSVFWEIIKLQVCLYLYILWLSSDQRRTFTSTRARLKKAAVMAESFVSCQSIFILW